MDRLNEIKEWKQLLDSGTITQAEFEEQKSRLLNQFSAHDNPSVERNAVSLDEVINKLSIMEFASGIAWAVIATAQIIGGFFFGMWWIMACGGWNVYVACSAIKRGGTVKQPYPGMVDEYRDSLVSIIIFIVINIVIGGVIGVVGCLFSLYIRNYVIKNEMVLKQLDNAVSLET
jgi:uncharacterized membrane protein YedE/YeeE